MAASARKDLLEMAAELTRDGGMLVGVFGFLEGALREHSPGVPWFLEVGAVSIIMMAVGIATEKLRP